MTRFNPVSIGTNNVATDAALVGGFTLIFGFVSLAVKEKLFLSESLVATVIGILFGPRVIDAFDPFRFGRDNINNITLQFSQIVIGVQVMAAAVSIPKTYWRKQWGTLLILWGPIMFYMWISTAIVVYLVTRVNFRDSLIIAASCAPTDPILANSIVSGRFADMHISLPIRYLLSAESAGNDGIGTLFYTLAIYLRTEASVGKAFIRWAYECVAYEVVGAAIFGALVGWLANWSLKNSERRNLIDKRNFLVFEISLALFIVGVSAMLGLSPFLAVFVAGIVFSWDGWFTEETAEAHVQETIDMLLNLTFFLYFGTSIEWSTFNTPELPVWRLILATILILLVRRVPIIFALHRYIPPLYSYQEAFFVGSFGPIGVAALWYMAEAVHTLHEVHEEAGQIVPVIQFIVLISVFVYGITLPFVHLTLNKVSTWSRSSAVSVPRWPSNTPHSVMAISQPISTAELPRAPTFDNADRSRAANLLFQGRPSISYDRSDAGSVHDNASSVDDAASRYDSSSIVDIALGPGHPNDREVHFVEDRVYPRQSIAASNAAAGILIKKRRAISVASQEGVPSNAVAYRSPPRHGPIRDRDRDHDHASPVPPFAASSVESDDARSVRSTLSAALPYHRAGRHAHPHQRDDTASLRSVGPRAPSLRHGGSTPRHGHASGHGHGLNHAMATRHDSIDVGFDAGLPLERQHTEYDEGVPVSVSDGSPDRITGPIRRLFTAILSRSPGGGAEDAPVSDANQTPDMSVVSPRAPHSTVGDP